jgi:protein-L-isoaspartate(D-aspartate) O-methyltransferase
MVQDLMRRGIRDGAVLAAMAEVPRHELVPEELQRFAYADRPLPIGSSQTISQPYIVAYMTQAARLSGSQRVLDVGTGSGYQAAILATMGMQVYSVEIIPELLARAEERFSDLAIRGVSFRFGDGALGWPEAAPFAAIIVAAASPEVPEALPAQLAEGGRLVIPIGEADGAQELLVFTRVGDELISEPAMPVRFVPMRHEILH